MVSVVEFAEPPREYLSAMKVTPSYVVSVVEPESTATTSGRFMGLGELTLDELDELEELVLLIDELDELEDGSGPADDDVPPSVPQAVNNETQRIAASDDVEATGFRESLFIYAPNVILLCDLLLSFSG